MLAFLKRFHIPVIIAVAAACVTGTSVLAQGNQAGATAGYKIGVVDMQKLIAEYPKRKQRYDELQRQVDAQQKGIDDMDAAIERQLEQLKTNGAQMTEEQRRQAVDKIEQDKSARELELRKRQRDVDEMEARVLREVIGDIENAVAQVAQSQNFHLILNSRGNSTSVVWFSPTVDITPSVEALLK